VLVDLDTFDSGIIFYGSGEEFYTETEEYVKSLEEGNMRKN